MMQVMTVKAEQMRELASKNPTTHGLLLYFALYCQTEGQMEIPQLRTELQNRGVEVNEPQLYDALQDLEDLNLGSVVYAQKDSGGVDTFKRGYNLNMYASRAFPMEYFNEWLSRSGQEPDLKLVDTKFKFALSQAEKEEIRKAESQRGRPKGWSVKLGRFLTPEELAEKEAKLANRRPRGRPSTGRKLTAGTGKRGRPASYSLKLGRHFTPEEMAAREAEKNNKRPRGRPAGWRKYPGQDNALRAKLSAMNKQSVGTGKRGRPAGYSPKLGRFLTAKELREKIKAPGKRGRPAGWRKDPAKVVAKKSDGRGPGRPPKASNTGRGPILRTSVDARVLNIPLKNNRSIRIEMPYKLSKDEEALLKLNLEHMMENS